MHKKLRLFSLLLDVGRRFFCVLLLCPNLGQLTVWKVKYELMTLHQSFFIWRPCDIIMTMTHHIFSVLKGSRKVKSDFYQTQTTRTNTWYYHQFNLKFVCIWCDLCENLLNSHLQKKAVRDTTQTAKMASYYLPKMNVDSKKSGILTRLVRIH